MKELLRFSLLFATAASAASGERTSNVDRFLQEHCLECHDAETQKGGLDLAALKFDLANSTNFNRWVLVHDRVSRR